MKHHPSGELSLFPSMPSTCNRSRSNELPGLGDFMLLFFLRPVTLHYRLQAAGINRPGAAFSGLVDSPAKRRYLFWLILTLLVCTPLLSLPAYLACEWLRELFVVRTDCWYYSVLTGVGAGLLIGLTRSMAGGVAYGTVLAVSLPPIIGLILHGDEINAMWPVFTAVCLFSAMLGFTHNSMHALNRGRAGSLPNLFWYASGSGILVTLLFVALYTSFEINTDKPAIPVDLDQIMLLRVWFDFTLIYTVCYLRLPFYVPEFILQSFLYAIQHGLRVPTLGFSPVLYHNLSYLPYPYLEHHLLDTANVDTELTKRVLNACLPTPGQRRTGKFVLARLQGWEIKLLLKQRAFNRLVALQGRWLPGTRNNEPTLAAVREAARFLHAAQLARFPYHRLQHLKRAGEAVNALNNQVLTDTSPLAENIAMSIPAWKNTITVFNKEAKVKIKQEIPNPFHAGEPLTPERGQDVFKGRVDLIAQLQSLLIDPGKSTSIALLGPRRCGKTSLLNMLPAMLPDIIWVFFDLQDNPIDTPASFFQALARRVKQQVGREHRLEIPALPAKGPVFQNAARWLEQLDKAAGKYRIMLCFDEFERLAGVFRGEQDKLVQMMGLFRATIQHRKRLRLLVSGVAPFDELDHIWHDHFINVRELKVGHLPKEAALDLLIRPVRGFPRNAITPQVADLICKRTGCQPYLVQLYGSYLVECLNEQNQRQARREDVVDVEKRVLDEATYYFRNLVQTAPQPVQSALGQLACGENPLMSIHTERWLKRRLLLTDDRRLSIPVLGKWIKTYW